MDNILGNANIIELIWTLTAGIGVLVTGYNVRNGLLNFLAIRAFQNGRRRIAFGNLRRDLLREVIQISQLTIGLFAAFDPHRASLAGLVWTLLLMPNSVILTVSTILDALDNRYILGSRK